MTYGVEAKSDQKILGYSYNIIASLALEHVFGRPIIIVAYSVHIWVRLISAFLFWSQLP